MKNVFREELLRNNKEFKKVFNELYSKNKLTEFDELLWDIISKDKTPIRITGYGPLAFIDLFRLGLTGGRCKTCSYELVLLLDKLGIYSEAVYVVNTHFKGTEGSIFGGHWVVETVLNNKKVVIDTSLAVMGNPTYFNTLGHRVVEKKDLDTLFKIYPDLVEYQDNMVVHSLTKYILNLSIRIYFSIVSILLTYPSLYNSIPLLKYFTLTKVEEFTLFNTSLISYILSSIITGLSTNCLFFSISKISLYLSKVLNGFHLIIFLYIISPLLIMSTHLLITHFNCTIIK